jgi:hypothetical protein
MFMLARLLDLESAEDLYQKRITRILTTDFPQYFAIVTRVRQELNTIGPEGGRISSTVDPQVQAVFPEGSLTKNIRVGLQVKNSLLTESQFFVIELVLLNFLTELAKVLTDTFKISMLLVMVQN